MGGQGCVWAFDRDQKRLQRLTANATATGASNVVARQVGTVLLSMLSCCQVMCRQDAAVGALTLCWCASEYII